MITIRKPEDIYHIHGDIQDGTFHGRWHFSFGDYYDPEFTHFGVMRVFNDDTLSPGAVWPLHPHHDIEVVTYCADGEFRHADEHGKGGVLKKGWVQHTTVGSGMWHSEVNNLPDKAMRFIQMWFYPSKVGLKPSVEQKAVEKTERTDRLLPIVSPSHEGALFIHSDGSVFSSFIRAGKEVTHLPRAKRGAYIYILEGGPIEVNGQKTGPLGAAMIMGEREVSIKAHSDTELLLVDVKLV